MRIDRLALAPALALLLILSACAHPTGQPSASGTPAPTKLNVAYSEVVFANLPLWVADKAGIFRENGLDVNLQMINSSNAVAALISGGVDVSHVGGSEVLSADVNGADLEIVGILGGTYPYELMAQPNLTTTDELRGAKIGVSSPGSSSDIATRVLLRKLGFDPDKDVNIVPVGSLANRTAALLNGAIDAGLDNPPGTIQQEAQGLHVLADMAEMDLPAANNTVTMQRSFVEQHPDVVQEYLDSMVEAMARIRSDPDLAVQVLKEYYKSNDDDAMQATYQYALKLMPTDPTPKLEQFTDAMDTLSTKGVDVQGFDVSSILDGAFVARAESRQGGGS